jgi:hypothetical protein
MAQAAEPAGSPVQVPAGHARGGDSSRADASLLPRMAALGRVQAAGCIYLRPCPDQISLDRLMTQPRAIGQACGDVAQR